MNYLTFRMSAWKKIQKFYNTFCAIQTDWYFHNSKMYNFPEYYIPFAAFPWACEDLALHWSVFDDCQWGNTWDWLVQLENNQPMGSHRWETTNQICPCIDTTWTFVHGLSHVLFLVLRPFGGQTGSSIYIWWSKPKTLRWTFWIVHWI